MSRGARALRLSPAGSAHTTHAAAHAPQWGVLPAGVCEGRGSAGGQPRQAAATEGRVLDSAGGEGPHPGAPTPPSRTFTLALSRQSQEEALGSGEGPQHGAARIHAGKPLSPEQSIGPSPWGRPARLTDCMWPSRLLFPSAPPTSQCWPTVRAAVQLYGVPKDSLSGHPSRVTEGAGTKGQISVGPPQSWC